jgi:hypothetical protein
MPDLCLAGAVERNDLAAVAQVVIDEVHRTTPLRMAFALAPWYDNGADEDNGNVYGVVHVADSPPDPAEPAQYGNAPDPTRMTHAVFTWDRDMNGHQVTFEEMLVLVAGLASGLVQVGLWGMRLNPSWPPCPEHAGRHPLRPVREPLVDVALVDRAMPMAANWRCYRPIVRGDSYQDAYGPTAIPVGKLAVRNGLSTTAG